MQAYSRIAKVKCNRPNYIKKFSQYYFRPTVNSITSENIWKSRRVYPHWAIPFPQFHLAYYGLYTIRIELLL